VIWSFERGRRVDLGFGEGGEEEERERNRVVEEK
jgi:hypothetical protein